MRGRSDGGPKKRVIALACMVALFACLVYMYYGSSSQAASALEYGRSLRKLGSSYLGGDDDDARKAESVTKFGQEDGDDNPLPKSFPACDDRHSEIIPCLDRNFISQMRMKLDLSVMEHCPMERCDICYMKC